MAGLAVDRCRIRPDRLTIIAAVHAVPGTVARITDGILIVADQADQAVRMVGSGSVVGVAERALQSLSTAGVDVTVMSGAQCRSAAGSYAGNAVLMTRTAGAGSGDIPVGGRSAMADDGAGTAHLSVGSASRDSGKDDFL